MEHSRTLSIRLDTPFGAAYEFLMNPENYASWASGLGESFTQAGGHWFVATPDGPMTVRFSIPNPYGVLDHYLVPRKGPEIYIPMRLLRHGSGCELLFTLQRRPEVTNEQFEADAAWVAKDLATLKRVLEAR